MERLFVISLILLNAVVVGGVSAIAFGWIGPLAD